MISKKVCILGDTHFGVKDGSHIMHAFFDKVYTNWFFDKLKELGIKTIIQLGDMFDRRKGVDSFSISESKRYFFDECKNRGIEVVILIGNHDIFFKESLLINSPDQLLRHEYENIEIVDKPTRMFFGTTSIDIIPWVCRENYEEVMDFIKKSDSELCFGHFEIDGFAMYKGMESHGGLSRSMFKRYKHVYSGHFHTRSTEGNITYVGTPCELTWNDWNDPRGIHILDSDTQEVEFHANPYRLYEKLVYDENNLQPLIPENIKDKYVKLYVESRTDMKKYDKYLSAITEVGVHDLKVIEDMSNFEQENVDDENLVLEDSRSLIVSYIEELDTDLDKDRLKKNMNSLYIQAMENV